MSSFIIKAFGPTTSPEPSTIEESSKVVGSFATSQRQLTVGGQLNILQVSIIER